MPLDIAAGLASVPMPYDGQDLQAHAMVRLVPKPRWAVELDATVRLPGPEWSQMAEVFTALSAEFGTYTHQPILRERAALGLHANLSPWEVGGPLWLYGTVGVVTRLVEREHLEATARWSSGGPGAFRLSGDRESVVVPAASGGVGIDVWPHPRIGVRLMTTARLSVERDLDYGDVTPDGEPIEPPMVPVVTAAGWLDAMVRF